jgi:dolichol-phosphate mannosyltransferase
MPAYNEEEGLEKLLYRIKIVMEYEKYEYSILVVNDGSSDRTQYVLECHKELVPLQCIKLDENRGITEVFRVGFQHVLANAGSGDIVATLDSDNTQSPYALIDLIKALQQGYEVAVASRFVEGSRVVGVPLVRGVLSRGVAFILGVLFPYDGLRDYSTFFRAYKVDLLQRVLERATLEDLIKGHGFSSMACFLLKVLYLGQPKVKEVPVTLRYDLKEGGTGMRIWRTIWGYLVVMRDLRNIKRDVRR